MSSRAPRFPWDATRRAVLVDAIRAAVSHAPQIAAVYLYGSALRDEPVGDVDLGFVQRPGTPPLVPRELAPFTSRVAERLGEGAPPLDVRRLSRGTAAFSHHVLSHGLLVAEPDPRGRAVEELAIVRDHLDSAWLLERYKRIRARRGHHAA